MFLFRLSLKTTCLICLAGWLVGCGGDPVEEIVADRSAAKAQSPISLSNEDWPWWRGPNRNGTAAGPVPPTEWGESRNILWKAPIPGRGHASPTVVNGRVYLATAREADQVQSVVAFDLETGRQLWEAKVHSGQLVAGIHSKSTHANGTVACDGRRLFVAFLNGGAVHVSALDLEGEILWQTEVGTYSTGFGYAASPALYEGLVLIAGDNSGSAFLTAVHRETGEIIWRKQRPANASYSSPIVAKIDGRDMLLISGAKQVTAYDPVTGEEIFSVPGCTQTTCGTLVWRGDYVFASGGYPGRETVCIHAQNRQPVWKNSVKCYEQSMIVVDDALYAFADGGILYCWDAATGTERWKKRLGGNVSSSLVAHGRLIYATDENGTTWVFEANPAGYREIARNQLGESGFATPSISRGRIFIRTSVGSGPERKEFLYCIGRPDAKGET